jgi:O-methyltransferase
MNNENKSMSYKPPVTEDYVPEVVKRLLIKIDLAKHENIVLYGFGSNMKWLFRLLNASGVSPILCDWRQKYIGYDCAGSEVISVDKIQNQKNCLLVFCVEEIVALKDGMKYVFLNRLDKIPAIYDRTNYHDPFKEEYPFKLIVQRASLRALSMISDAQLFDLIQFVRLTKDVPGDVVEYGSLYGGSGAIIAEALNIYGKKPLWLFDSFSGIPQSSYGLDYRWSSAFSDNSYSEVRDAFIDLDNVIVVPGNIMNTHSRVENPISFGYLASDTLESGEILLKFMWPKLSPGGIIAICDYGSYPNCIPLTMYTDHFFEDKPEALIFHTAKVGIFVMKKF